MFLSNTILRVVSSGVPSSAISLYYFISRVKRTANTYLFIFINITDLLTCCLMLFIGISHFGLNMFFDNTIFCNAWAITWQVTIRLSVLLVGVLSITRAHTILKPLKQVSSNVVIPIVLVYTSLLFCQSTIPYWVDSVYIYRVEYSRCTWNSTEHLGCSYADKAFTTMQMLVEWSLPVIPVFICCAILILKLRFSQRPGNGNSVVKKHRARTRSAVTVIILTCAYILCSFPSALFQFIYYFSYIRGCNNSSRLKIIPLVKTLLTTFAIPLNSVINTVIYYYRIKDLRLFAFRLLKIDYRIYPQEEREMIAYDNTASGAPSTGITRET